VDIPASPDEFPQFYIVPTQILDEWLKSDFKIWRDTPGKIKQQRSPDNKRRLFYMDDDTSTPGHGYLSKLKPYRELGSPRTQRGTIVAARFRYRHCRFGVSPEERLPTAVRLLRRDVR
jgi:hypothetical protein